MTHSASTEKTLGFLYALAAFFAWGVLPIYWKFLHDVAALQIMLNRVVWCLFFLVIALTAGKRWGEVRELLRVRKAVLLLCCSSLMIAANWLIYIWSVNSNHMVEASLGYYINPLISVLLGMVFLKETTTAGKGLALLFAFAGVTFSMVQLGTFPWISLSLAFSFALYGLLRKLVHVHPFIGLTLEALILFPFALIGLFLYARQDALAFGTDLRTTLLLIGSGIATIFPLVCFAAASQEKYSQTNSVTRNREEEPHATPETCAFDLWRTCPTPPCEFTRYRSRDTRRRKSFFS